jgi:hypothetical protein
MCFAAYKKTPSPRRTPGPSSYGNESRSQTGDGVRGAFVANGNAPRRRTNFRRPLGPVDLSHSPFEPPMPTAFKQQAHSLVEKRCCGLTAAAPACVGSTPTSHRISPQTRIVLLRVRPHAPRNSPPNSLPDWLHVPHSGQLHHAGRRHGPRRSTFRSIPQPLSHGPHPSAHSWFAP